MRSPVPTSAWSLRNRLVLGVVFLSAMGFIISDFAAQSYLRSYLIAQVDIQLANVANESLGRLAIAGIDSDDEDNRPVRMNRYGRALPVGPIIPLRRIPTTIELTLFNPAGEIVGAIGGDFNRTDISNQLTGMDMEGDVVNSGEPFTIETSEIDFRAIARELPNQSGTVVISQSLDELERTLGQLKALFLLIGLVALALIALASRYVIKIGLRPFDAVERTAEKIAGGDLSARLPDIKPNTEVGRLVTTLNKMLGRIEESFAARKNSEDKLRRFVADASHELRTPITAIRGFAELHRQGAVAGGDETKALLVRIENESMRMGSLVEDLLLLARLDQAREMERKPVDLTKTVADAVESARAAGPDHPVSFNKPAEDIFTLGDSLRIYQAISNLLANARAHTPAGTPIIVEISQGDTGVRISVIDKGPGLQENDQKKIFERFYRADPSRVRNGGEGSGLGLSIVDAVMRAHGGSVSVASKFGEGATFTLFFPVAN